MLRDMMLGCLAALLATAAASTEHTFTIEDMLQPKQAPNQPGAPAAAPPSAAPLGAPAAAPALGGPTAQPAAGLQVMQSLLGAAGSAGAAPLGAGRGSQALSVESMDVVNGMVTAFMHKVQLAPGEKSCLENNIGQLTGDVIGTGQDVVTAIKAMMKGKAAAKRKTGNLVSAGIDGAMKIASLVTLATQLIRNCVQGDALEMLKRTGQHMINAQYLGHRFVVNGVDIAHGLSDSIVAFEAKDFHRFGTDIGTALRKILLSDATNGTRALPEGVPEQKIIEKVTAGVMGGFFTHGSRLEITDSAQPDVDIRISLHQCFAGNEPFFNEIWLGIWDLVAQLALNGPQHGFAPQPQPGSPAAGAQTATGQPKWQGELMVALMQLPLALQRCGLGQESQEMFMEAIKSLHDVHVKFVLPAGHLQALPATDKMAKAVEAWTNWDFEKFGKEIGMLLRELVMLAFPKKYSVDSQGRLRRELMGYSSVAQANVGSRQPNWAMFTIVGSCALSVLVAMLAVRSMRSANKQFRSNELPTASMEDGLCKLEEIE